MATDPENVRAGAGQHIPSPEDVLEASSDEGRSAENLMEGLMEGRADRLRDLDVGRVLGYVSVGLGLAALLAPGPLGRLTGLQQHPGLLRVIGTRELASAAGLLTQKDKMPWLWSRVVGDAMDLALLGTASRPSNPGRNRALGAIAAVAALAAVDVAASLRETSRRKAPRPGVKARSEPLIEHAVTVGRSPQECYAFWRDVTNHPKFSRMLESVTPLDERRSRWVLKPTSGSKVEWDSEITVDKPGEKLAWHSVGGSAVSHAGVVQFQPAPGGRGTVMRVMMHYRAPAGRLASGLAKMLGKDPNAHVREDLRRFKALMETGEIPTTQGQPSGRRSFLGRMTPDGRKSNEARSNPGQSNAGEYS